MFDFESKTIYQFYLGEIIDSTLVNALTKYKLVPYLLFQLDDSKVTTLMNSYIKLNNASEIVVESENSANDETNADIISFMERFCKWLNDTYPYYSKMLDFYEQNLSSLMSQVSDGRTLKTGVSDMPQTATFDAAPTSDALSGLTNVEETRVSDYGTKMSRLREIKDHLASLYQDWSKDFIKTFVYY